MKFRIENWFIITRKIFFKWKLWSPWKILFEQATFQRSGSDSLQVSLTGALRTKVDNRGANVMVALYESGLVTDCPKGENRGRVLSNDFVVRKLEKLCTVKDISAKKTVTGSVNFPLWQGFHGSKCGVTVFVQDSSHLIFGSQNFQLPDEIWDSSSVVYYKSCYGGHDLVYYVQNVYVRVSISFLFYKSAFFSSYYWLDFYK